MSGERIEASPIADALGAEIPGVDRRHSRIARCVAIAGEMPA